MLRVHQPQERALGHRRRQILELLQAIEPHLPNAREIGLAQARLRRHVGEQRGAARGEPRQRGDRERRHVGADVHVVVGADPGQRVGHVDGAERARAFVHHVGDDGGQALFVGRVGAGTALDLQQERDDRDARMLDGPHLESVGQRVPRDLGKRERRIGSDLREAGIDRRPLTTRTLDRSRRSASAGWPRGITLNTTRASRRRCRAAAERTLSCVARR